MELMLRDSRLSGVLCSFFGRGARNKQVTEGRSEEDQKKIRRRSEEDQRKIRRRSEEDQKEIRRRRRVKKVGTPVRKALLAAVCPPLGAGQILTIAADQTGVTVCCQRPFARSARFV